MVVSHQPLSLSAPGNNDQYPKNILSYLILPGSPRNLDLPQSLSSTLVGLGGVLEESEWASVASFPSEPFPLPVNIQQMAEVVDVSVDEVDEEEGPITLDCPNRPSRIFTISSRRPTEVRPTTC